MMRWATIVGLIALLAAAAYAAGDACPNCQGDHQAACPQCKAGAAQPGDDQPADNLAAVVTQDARRERIETLQEWGFTLQDLQLIRAYKMRMHRLKEQLDDALQNLAVIMYSRYEDPKQREEVARQALEKCQAIQREDQRLQEELIERIGAKDDPVKMAGLILLGAVYGGRRTMCEVHVGVAGGAQATGAAIRGPELRQTLGGWRGRPPTPWRWWRRFPGARGQQQAAQPPAPQQ